MQPFNLHCMIRICEKILHYDLFRVDLLYWGYGIIDPHHDQQHPNPKKFDKSLIGIIRESYWHPTKKHIKLHQNPKPEKHMLTIKSHEKSPEKSHYITIPFDPLRHT